MRYYRGILFGALIPGIIFLGAAMIKLSGYGVTDPVVIQSLWSLYQLWFVVAIALIVGPLVVTYIRIRDAFREILVFEIGGLAFFGPLWFVLATDLSGTPWAYVIAGGVVGAIPFPGPSGGIEGLNIGPIVLIPAIVLSLLAGIYVLRPSFVKSFATGVSAPARVSTAPASAPATPSAPTTPTAPPARVDEKEIQELRAFLTQQGVTPAQTEAILAAGISSLTELGATPPEDIARISGMDVSAANSLNAAVQKKVWFEGL